MNSSDLRVAAIGITPPVYRASGGIAAALQLMRHVSAMCDTSMYLMADRNEDCFDGGLSVSRRPPTNSLSWAGAAVPRQVRSMLWRPRGLKQWLLDRAPSIVHMHNPHPPGALLAAARLCRELAIPYVISTHGFVEIDNYSKSFGAPRWQRPLLKAFLRNPILDVVTGASSVFALSPQEYPMLEHMGVSATNIRVVTNGVDPYFLDTVSEVQRESLIRRFKLPAGIPLFLFVGNHTANKGLDVLLRAIVQMKSKAVVVIAGPIRSKAEHEQLIRSCGLPASDPRFLFTDFISREELRALYQSVDGFVFPSRADTLPLVILEAMASGLVVIATRVGGIPYEVTPDTGVVISPNDPAVLAQALDTLCVDRNLRCSMGVAGRERVKGKFDWTSSAQMAVAAYKDVLSSWETGRLRNGTHGMSSIPGMNRGDAN